MIERNTKQKQVIIEELKKTKAHPTALELFEKLSKENGVSRATVFRILSNLVEKGVIQKITIPDSDERFDYNTNNHYHFKCKECGRVYDIDVDYTKELDRQARHNSEFLIEGHSVEFYGICKLCKDKNAKA